MTHHDDFAFEPVEGLPSRPPRGEVVLWQGRPDAWTLACESLAIRWVAGWFVLLALWRGGAAAADGSVALGLAVGLPYLGLGLLACAILYVIAWAQARATVYTLTSARVVMRIGAALSVTFNIPFRQIEAADLKLGRGGVGTIALRTTGESRLSYLVCWPHVRPWRAGRTQPALRCIPDAARVAAILGEAADARLSAPVVAARPYAVAAE